MKFLLETKIQIFIKKLTCKDKKLTNNNSLNNKKNSTILTKLRQVEEYRQGILSQILSPEAKDRRKCLLKQVIKIKLVKP